MSLTPQELAVTVQDIMIVRYTTVSALALLAYDYCLTFDEEKRLVWPSRFSLPKIVFLLNRYLLFIGLGGLVRILVVTPTTSSICKPAFLGFGSVTEFSYLIAEFILYMRAYAIWGGTRAMLVLLGMTLASVYGVGLVFVVRFLKSVTVVPIALQPTGCIITFGDQIDWAAFLVLIVSEIFALTLLLVKAWKLSHSAIMKTIFRDGVVYFIFILVASIANVLILRFTSSDLCNFLLGTQAALHSVLCNRLLLHIRGAYESMNVHVYSRTTAPTMNLQDAYGPSNSMKMMPLNSIPDDIDDQ